MRRSLLICCGIFLSPLISNSQCPTASFQNPDTICANSIDTLINTSTGGVTYQWDFCGGDFSLPLIYAADDPHAPDGPTSINLVYDSTNWYGFLFNYFSMTITRYDYGNSLDNIPDSVDLGNLNGAITGGAFWNDMSFIKQDSNWYGIFGIYGGTKIVTVSFGTHLDNDTPGTSLYPAPASDLAFQDLKVDHDSIFLFMARDNQYGEIYRFSYGTSITNTPVVDDITIPGSYQECGDISLVKYCNHWYGFVAEFTAAASSILRLDFGNSLSNAPTVTDLGNPSGALHYPWSLDVAYDGDQWYGFEMDFQGNLHRIDFGKDLTNISPTGMLLNPPINGIGASVRVVKSNSTFYLFTCGRDNGVFSKTKYEAPCNVTPQISSQTNAIVTFKDGGNYIVSVSAADSSGNINYYSDSVFVNYSPTVNFSFQNTCFHDITSFWDSSFFNQGSITSRLWNFGDSTTDASVNPQHQYARPGKYVVTLTLNGSLGCNTVHTDTVYIGAIPTANFIDSAGCSNIPITFNDSSTVGDSNTIVQWHWDFGNSDTSNVQNPVYQYPLGGTYTVTLTATTNYNCSATHQNSITVKSTPKTGFTVSSTCRGDTAVFRDTSSINIGSIVSWNWNFGDTNTDTAQNTTHAYKDTVETYAVSLIASSALGCMDTATMLVKINNVPKASFVISPTTLCEGNTVNLTDSSSVSGDTIYAWHWNFGDNDSSFSKNPNHAYDTAGTYNIILTVYSQTSCASTDTQTVTVVPSPVAGFTFTPVCIGDSTHFTDISIPPLGDTISSWHWDFGNGDTSSAQSPVYHYDSAATYFVNLTVNDKIGCTNVFGDSVAVHALPVAGFTCKNNLCSSIPLQFLDTSSTAGGAISIYSWIFGDSASGSSDSSSDSSPTHIYYQHHDSVYAVTLAVTTIFGCSDTITLNTAIKQTSKANFDYLPSCEMEQMIFTNEDSVQSIDSLWNWDFGDGGASFIQNPAHYYVASGIFTVTLTVTSHGGCVSVITKNVEVKPNPVAGFVTAPACLNTPYLFQDTSNVSSGSVTKWFWALGNGDSSNVQFPQTTYQDTGDYVIHLTVIADTISGCANSTKETIHVYPLPVANFNYDPLYGSPPLQVNFHDLSTDAVVYSWSFGDGGTSTDSSPSYTFMDTGKFSITEWVYSDQGCADSATKVFYVIKPRLDIAVTSVSYQLENNLFKVSAQVANLGTRDITSYHMQASIQDGAAIDEEVNTTLPSGAQGVIEYHFTAGFLLSPEQNINYYCVSALQPNGETDDNASNNEKCATLTNNFTVVQPYPNPFSEQLQLQFILPYKGQITVELFDVIGQKIATLYDDVANAGGTTLQVSTAALASQFYYCRFTFSDQTLVYPVGKMPLKKQ